MRADLEFRSIPGAVAASAAAHGDRTALVDGDRLVTYRDLEVEMMAAARAMVAIGIGHGDHVAIWAPNSAQWIYAALGAQAAGAAIVPLNTRFKADEAAYVLTKSRAKAVITVADFGIDFVGMLREHDATNASNATHASNASNATQPAGAPPVIVARGSASGTTAWSEFLRHGEHVDVAVVQQRMAALSPEDRSDVMFTSGTTGHPKGVVLTHGQSLRAFGDYCDCFELSEHDTALVIPPFFHSFGYKGGWLACFMRGATVITVTTFDPLESMQLIERHRVTFVPGPPTLFTDILNHPRRADFDLSSLRVAMPSAASVPVQLIRRIRDELGCKSVGGYGLTESTAICTLNQIDDDPEILATTVGRAAPDLEIAIFDDEGRELAHGTPGEIWIRGYTVMSGYLDDPVETAKAVDASGWLHTGDIGTLDDAGYVRITDRKKDMYIVGGFNVAPAEVEAQLRRHDSIGHVAVIGVPDPRMGEVGAAFVVPRPGLTVDLDALAAWAKEHMANFKVPRYWHVVDALPVNASMKVRKTELRELARQLWPPVGDGTP
jgi:HIP---CoA ligase